MIFQLEFNKNWFMQSSKEISEYGEVISTSNFTPKGWFEVEIPTTVVNGLVANNLYENPYYGINLKSIPGYKADITTQNFESQYKPKDSPYRVSWWFRKEFKIENHNKNNQYWIKFKGINYSANIWLNGKRIAGSDYVIGTYRIYDIRVTNFIKPEKNNVIALEVFSPNPDDLSISFVDWSPLPPDDDMGIWQPIIFYSTGPVKLNNPFIESKLDIKTLQETELIISLSLVNTKEKRVKSILKGKMETIEFQKSIELEPFENKEIQITPEEFSQLKIQNPRIWWPYQWGEPELYKIELDVFVNDQISDSTTIDFGIREIKSSINEHGSRIFSINGREFLARGAAWTPDMMLNQDERRDNYDIFLIKNLNFNVIRLEGKLASDNFWDLCDKEGILVLPGWVCCSHWEKWKDWKQGDFVVGKKSLRSQLLRLRNHPSLIGWFYGSDFPPPVLVEKVYLEIFKNT
ncbi:MAG: hypothetical protein JSV04_03415 [Candidatus Heimdallarchaeota archaeon]|nr:MAG: hypothetical protein JSV04_03415 [Candidatus Heimdallarchaeota archaeon]